METCILPFFYWGPVQYYSKLYKYPSFVWEQFETYPKQTFRNRCEIYGPNGKLSLQVPVEKGSFHKTLLKELKVSYNTPWQKNHFKSIEAAYRSSPFFEYYADDLIPVYTKKPVYLIDLNVKILEITFEWLGMYPEIVRTDDYQPVYSGADFRDCIHPKGSKNKPDIAFKPMEYMQGFEQRHGFIPNLSILDLVFNLGPQAAVNLKESIQE